MVIVCYIIFIIAYRIEKMNRDNVFTSKIYFSKGLKVQWILETLT